MTTPLDAPVGVGDGGGRRPSASSASHCTMGHTVTPMAAIASSMTGNWATSSGGMPSLVL